MGKLRKRGYVILAMGLVLMLAMGTGSVSGLEIPVGTTRVSVPVTLSADAPFAGVEIEFQATDGLAYEGFSAGNVENKVDVEVGGKRYFGFFSTTNRYTPNQGVVAVGNLVFTYSGNAPQSVTLKEVRLHRRTDSGGIQSVSYDPGTIISVTRSDPGPAPPADGGSNTENGGTDSGNNNQDSGAPVNNPGNGNAATGSGQGGSGRGTSNTGAAGGSSAVSAPAGQPELDAALASDDENRAETESSKAETPDGNQEIAEADVPLSSSSASTLWIWFVVAAAAIVGSGLVIFFVRRKKRMG